MSAFFCVVRRSLVIAALLVIVAASVGSATVHAATKPVIVQTDPSLEQQVVNLVNVQRAAKKGCKPLSINPTLATIARDHSADMLTHNFFGHQGSNKSSPWDRMKRAGYRYSTAGENVAAGYATPAAVMNAWMHSSAHRANILNCNFTEIGVGLAFGGGKYGYYWTQDFGKPL